MRPEFTAEVDIFAFLETLDERDALKEETIMVVAPGASLWVPFGWFLVACPLHANRQTKQLLDEGKKAKKARRGAAVKPDKAYSAFSFVPFIEKGADFAAEYSANAVRMVSASLTFNAEKLPSSLRSNASWQSWVEHLEAQAKNLAKEISDDKDGIVAPTVTEAKPSP